MSIKTGGGQYAHTVRSSSSPCRLSAPDLQGRTPTKKRAPSGMRPLPLASVYTPRSVLPAAAQPGGALPYDYPRHACCHPLRLP
jgi:hypothetical protein